MLSRTGSHPVTEYMVSAPRPAAVEGVAGFGMQIRVVPLTQAEMDSLSTNPLWVSTDSSTIPPDAYQVSGPGPYSILSSKPLWVTARSEVPLGAWIPREHSRVTIDFSRGMLASDTAELWISEHYRFSPRDEPALLPLQGADGQMTTLKSFSMPTMDLVGQYFEFVVPDSNAVFVINTNPLEHGGSRELPLPVELRDVTQGRGAGVLVQVWVPFSVRVGVLPFFGDHPFNAYVNTHRVGSDVGTVHLRVKNPPEVSTDLRATLDYIKRHPTVDRGIDLSMLRGPAVMTFEYPPLPAESGVNVYGEIGSLKVSDGSGSLVVNGRTTSLPTRMPVEFRKITEFRTTRGAAPLPQFLGMDADSANLNFTAESRVIVDGRELTARWRRLAVLWQLAGILACLITIDQGWRAPFTMRMRARVAAWRKGRWMHGRVAKRRGTARHKGQVTGDGRHGRMNTRRPASARGGHRTPPEGSD